VAVSPGRTRLRGLFALLASLVLAASACGMGSALADGGQAVSAKKRCKKAKKGALAAKKKCKKHAPSTTPPVATPAPASLSINPTSHSFGVVNVSASKVFTVTNGGGSASGALSDSVTGSNAGDFSISEDACAGISLGAGASCTLKVTFRPSTPSFETATLNVSGSPGGTASASLSGQLV
jgi:hypothetical protein